ncbi:MULTISPECIES: FeoC-like transcriptional regulator [Vibrio]|uniref:FeoC like transcriptional regulator n=2 Tax=Vibrio TaxID=662 RepID=A0AA34XNU0_9VIBR|nr:MULTISPECIES: FeoC-like transcriptional regulator [Vibrio]ARP38847.1 FeoC like transcriptional regulator [Vibrio syngnathi]MDH6019178.1 FeoC-like transcriptional regulator [Vibrio splendidus]PML57206.1 iron transporter FeoC [Vibrio lentus]PMM39917.1 iron transporter FeoC [Vibrio lentus]PMO37849.1 iron transporter FeoC [Vibrio splendidus]
MILTELHQYIDNEGVAARSELASKFGMSEDGVDAMLSVWVKKGKISRLVDTNKHGHTTRIRYTISKQDGLSLNVMM